MKVTTGSGATSCLSVRLHDVAKFIHEMGIPLGIDSSEQFGMYKDYPGQDVSALVFDEYQPKVCPYVGFDHGWQYGWYDSVQIENLSKMASVYCPIKKEIHQRANDWFYNVRDRVCILYRGNDKSLEIPRTNYQAMVEMALATGEDKFLVQTDEEDFYQFFKERFPDTVCFNELPRIRKNPDSYVMPRENKSGFCVDFITALIAISKAEKLILNTGNTGLWTMIFRGHANNVWQYHGNHQTWKKL